MLYLFELCRALSKLECVIAGLSGKVWPPKLRILETEEKGTGIVIDENVKAGQYVLEYPLVPVRKCFICSSVLGMLKFLNCGPRCGLYYAMHVMIYTCVCMMLSVHVQWWLVVQCLVDHVQMLHMLCSSKHSVWPFERSLQCVASALTTTGFVVYTAAGCCWLPRYAG